MSDQLQVQMNFPPGFLWGTAVAAHQVEGGQHNNWTVWENGDGGRIFSDQVSGAACEWWDGRAEEDFARAASLHNNALRLSVEWSRIEPEPGRWDEAALDRYRAMITDLRASGMEPMVTLHHFTNPVWLEERGGWLHEDTPRLFARYAARVADALGDGVRLWCTINEPAVYATLGYLAGFWPPGHRHPGETATVVQRLVEGHAAAYRTIKAVHPEAQIGFAKHQIAFRSGTPVLGDLAVRLAHSLFNEAIFGPFIDGRLRLLLRTVPIPQAQGTLDWIGLQYYRRATIHFNPRYPEMGFFEPRVPAGALSGPEQWGELAPEESYHRIRHLYKLVRRPIYITEMGVPDADDSVRPAYLARTVQSVWKACAQNYPVKGFFFWSLIDNFEWAEGYDPRYRFGLYGVDFQTQARTERRSARLYRAICGANALTAAMVREHAPEALDAMFPVPDTL